MMQGLILIALFLTAHSMAGQQTPTLVRPSSAATPVSPHVNEGQRVFEQNCSRCHNPPDGFSPRISGAVVRHMRVRANLSDTDMKAIMQFLHP